jgi:hypothetical protein
VSELAAIRGSVGSRALDTLDASLEGTPTPGARRNLALETETPLLIGVDGGATEVKAHAIEEVPGGLVEAPERATFRYVSVAGFEPAPIAEQIAEREAGRVRIGALEREQGDLWIEACAEAVASVGAGARRSRVLVGVCMPGLKTRDGRGIDAMRNGPRMIDFADRLEARLTRAGFVLDAPIARIASDGDACGHGEEASPTGGFRGVANAWYVGGGTGLAECFKLDGRVTGLDELSGRIEKGWAMTSSLGRSYEDHLSMRGINARFVELGGRADAKPEQAWVAREPEAVQAFSECVVMLDELLGNRLEALKSAGLPAPTRLVVGQRLGTMLASEELGSLRAFAERSCRIEMHVSTLRAAPAIGAAWIAREAWGAPEGSAGRRSSGDEHAG